MCRSVWRKHARVFRCSRHTCAPNGDVLHHAMRWDGRGEVVWADPIPAPVEQSGKAVAV